MGHIHDIIGKNVRHNRKKKMFSQHGLATRIGSDQTTISDIELGKTNFHINILIAIANVLKVRLVSLIKNT